MKKIVFAAAAALLFASCHAAAIKSPDKPLAFLYPDKAGHYYFGCGPTTCIEKKRAPSVTDALNFVGGGPRSCTADFFSSRSSLLT